MQAAAAGIEPHARMNPDAGLPVIGPAGAVAQARS
jgi:hypothetical protein